MINDKLLKRLAEIIEQGNIVFSTRIENGGIIETDKLLAFRTAALSFIQRVYGSRSPQYIEFEKHVYDKFSMGHPSVDAIKNGLAQLSVIKDEIAGDWLFTVKGLIGSEIFADFLEMAEYLVAQDYKDAAAVIAGSALEEHLRQLCLKNGIEIVITTGTDVKPKKADSMNSDLSGKDVYNKLDQKAVTTWLDLRNKAAHGKYTEYNKQQVEGMIQAVIEFMARVSL